METTARGSWKTFVARQPILDRKLKVVGYELLFRSGMENFFMSDLPDQASSNVLVSSLFLIGMQSMTDGQTAYVNFTRNLLVNDYSFFLPPQQSVIEILEDVVPDATTLEVCKNLKKNGYRLALDDYPPDNRMAPFLPYADIVKVDWLDSPPEFCRDLARELPRRGICMLAEKIETYEQYHQACGMGYELFQGFFFCKPEILGGRDIPVRNMNCLMLLEECNREEPNLAAVEKILMQEPSLCYKFLRYLSSAAFCFRSEIKSVRHALSLIGMYAIRKWISLVVLAGLGDYKPEALVAASVTRARLCESIGKRTLGVRASEELFLLGLLSLVDAILDQPMRRLMQSLPVSDEIRKTLLGENTRYRPIYEMVLAYERSHWGQVGAYVAALGLDEEAVTASYFDAVSWSHEFIRASSPISQIA